MCRRWIFILVALAALLYRPAAAEDADASAHARKVVHRVVPVYPDLARRMSLTGSVKIVALVAANGSVKSVEPLGGNPVLLKAAQEAVMNWKYAAGPEETREQVELRFH